MNGPHRGQFLGGIDVGPGRLGHALMGQEQQFRQVAMILVAHLRPGLGHGLQGGVIIKTGRGKDPAHKLQPTLGRHGARRGGIFLAHTAIGVGQLFQHGMIAQRGRLALRLVTTGAQQWQRKEQ